MEMLIFCYFCWINEENDFDLIVLIKFIQFEDIFKLDFYFIQVVCGTYGLLLFFFMGKGFNCVRKV